MQVATFFGLAFNADDCPFVSVDGDGLDVPFGGEEGVEALKIRASGEDGDMPRRPARSYNRLYKSE